MVRVKRGNIAVKRRKKYLDLAKGYKGSNSKLSIFAGEQVTQSLYFSYIGRRLKKRNFRRIWIYRINAASRSRQNIYSRLIGSLRKTNIFLNRKILASLAFIDFSTFNVLERQSRNNFA